MTLPRQPDRRQLDAVGALTITSPDGIEYQLTGVPGGLDLRAGRLRDLFSLRRQGPGDRRRSRLLAQAHSIVRHTGLTVFVSVADSEVVRLSPASSGGSLSRITGLGPADVSLSGLLRALWRSIRRL